MIGVDERTYQTMYKRTFAECLHRYRGDTTEARKLTAYYMRDWYVVTDGDNHAASSTQRKMQLVWRPVR